MNCSKQLSAKIKIAALCAIFFSFSLFSQNSPYQAVRLNNGNPIIEPAMFANPSDGENINGPSLIRVPDWIPVDERADPTAQYYLYFADHAGDYIRMAWAANVDGPYTLYNDFTTPGDRGVLDNNNSDIILGNAIRIEENHLASPDVLVDEENQRIIMYFHSGSSFYVDGVERNRQVSWVSTAPYGLEFYDGIEPVHLGSSYFRVFDYNGDVYALDNGAKINKALDGANPWVAPPGHDFATQLWELSPNHVFQNDIPVPSAELRVRHTGVHVVDNELQVFYSRRGEFQERIQLSTVDMTADWTQWDPTYPPIEILAPNPGWEGGEREMFNSKTSAGINVNQLRDPDIFEDHDSQLYLVYTGNGEGGLGIAKLYKTPEINTTLNTIADAHIKESSLTGNFGGLSKVRTSMGSSASARRTIYMKFDLSEIANLEHAVVRLFANVTTGGPVTIYETGNDWDENTLATGNAPALGKAITTTHLTESNQFYDWNITAYAKANLGAELSIALNIAPSNTASHEFGSIESNKAGQLLLVTTPEEDICNILIEENNFDLSYGNWVDGGSDCTRSASFANFASGGTGACVRLRDNSSTSVLTTKPLDLVAFSNITVDFTFIANSMETGEDFWLQLSTDGGNSYTTIADWIADETFVNGTRYFESITIDGPFSLDTRIRFRMDATANADLLYLDDIRISGCQGANATSTPDEGETTSVGSLEDSANSLLAYPNPFRDILNISIPNYDGASDVKIVLIDSFTSATVMEKTFNQAQMAIDTNALETGLYVLQIFYTNQRKTETLMKVNW